MFRPALERPEGVSQHDYAAMEEFQQRTNAVSLEKVKAYYRRLRYVILYCVKFLTRAWDILPLKGRVHPVVHKLADVQLGLLSEQVSRSRVVQGENWPRPSGSCANRLV